MAFHSLTSPVAFFVCRVFCFSSLSHHFFLFNFFFISLLLHTSFFISLLFSYISSSAFFDTYVKFIPSYYFYHCHYTHYYHYYFILPLTLLPSFLLALFPHACSILPFLPSFSLALLVFLLKRTALPLLSFLVSLLFSSYI